MDRKREKIDSGIKYQAVENDLIDLNEEESEEILSKYDREFAFRRLKGPMAKFVFCLAVGWSMFQLYTAIFGTFPSTLQRAPHVGAALILVFLLYPMRKGTKTDRIAWYDYLFAFLSFIVSAYHIVFYEDLIWRGGLYTDVDMIVAVIAIFLVLEATRRLAGPVIVILASVFLIYGLFGQYFPSFMAHSGISIKRLATFEWFGTDGILGSPVYVSSTFIFLFLLFATFLKKSGIGDWMTGIAVGLTGGSVGGPAKAAVIASATQGTLSGSSVANTVSTGSLTIPLMKQVGYRKEFAGAVEAAASTGGQLMPPIMGAAAFIMTEFIGQPYSVVALAACIPALLYFMGIFTTVHFEALKYDLRGMPKSELPDWKKMLKQKWFLMLPIVAIVVMLVKGFTPMTAALWGIIACIVAWAIKIIVFKEQEFTFGNVKNFFVEIIYGLEEGAKSALPVAVSCATAGIIVGVITLSGLGLKMAGGIVALADGNLYMTMFLTMICSIVLGMGVPTTANYIIQATVSAPALIQLGVEPIAAHLFVFYFGIIADITPPVALAAFAGSGIAGSDPLKTGFEAFRLGFAAYLVPYMFVLSPVLVMVRPEGVTTMVFVLMMIKAIITAVIGMMGIGAGNTGYFITHCSWIERIILFVGGITLINPSTMTDLIGMVFLVAVLVIQKGRKRKQQAVVA